MVHRYACKQNAHMHKIRKKNIKSRSFIQQAVLHLYSAPSKVFNTDWFSVLLTRLLAISLTSCTSNSPSFPENRYTCTYPISSDWLWPAVPPCKRRWHSTCSILLPCFVIIVNTTLLSLQALCWFLAYLILVVFWHFVFTSFGKANEILQEIFLKSRYVILTEPTWAFTLEIIVNRESLLCLILSSPVLCLEILDFFSRWS